MNKLTFVVLSATLTTLMTGCSSLKPRCPMDGSGGPDCISMSQSYDYAERMPISPKSASVPLYAKDATPGIVGNNAATNFSNFPQPRQVGMPVYEPAKIFRAWTAPWTDADGNMRGGEYVYFTTPGRWAYGGLTSPGDASDVFRPLRADDPGMPVNFQNAAVAEVEKKAVPAKPVHTSPGQPGTQGTPPATPSTGITQPYQKITTSNAPAAQ
jgi:hypothetical protein